MAVASRRTSVRERERTGLGGGRARAPPPRKRKRTAVGMCVSAARGGEALPGSPIKMLNAPRIISPILSEERLLRSAFLLLFYFRARARASDFFSCSGALCRASERLLLHPGQIELFLAKEKSASTTFVCMENVCSARLSQYARGVGAPRAELIFRASRVAAAVAVNSVRLERERERGSLGRGRAGLE